MTREQRSLEPLDPEAIHVTANAGMIALVRPVGTGGAVMTVHWLFFSAVLAVVALLFYRGRIARAGGFALLLLYVAYWVANYS